MEGQSGKRRVLRAGYAAIIAVFVASAGEAYRIQASLSRQHLEIYRHYVDDDAALATLRHNLWQAASDIRDFFIRTTPAQAELLRRQLDALESEDERALNYLERHTAHSSMAAKLRSSLGVYRALADPLPRTMLHEPKEKQFDFLQEQIVPRRDELAAALADLAAADQQKLRDGEKEFADARRRAAGRLLPILSFGVVLAVAVARLSIRREERLEWQAESHVAEVEGARRELQQLSARLLEIEEEGKRRLSRELHDEIGQTLALLQIEISHAQKMLPGQPEGATRRLQRAREMAERTVRAVRNVAVLLRPALLDDLGLVPALQSQLEDFPRRSGIECELAQEGAVDELPDMAKTCVYRVVQEALHNCEKHSGATRVKVSVRRLTDSLVAEIEDNGRGFVWNDRRMPSGNTGLGLLGIRERAAAAGGTLIVDSAPEKGTRIALRIPLEAARQPKSEPPRRVVA